MSILTKENQHNVLIEDQLWYSVLNNIYLILFCVNNRCNELFNHIWIYNFYHANREEWAQSVSLCYMIRTCHVCHTNLCTLFQKGADYNSILYTCCFAPNGNSTLNWNGPGFVFRIVTINWHWQVNTSFRPGETMYKMLTLHGVKCFIWTWHYMV